MRSERWHRGRDSSTDAQTELARTAGFGAKRRFAGRRSRRFRCSWITANKRLLGRIAVLRMLIEADVEGLIDGGRPYYRNGNRGPPPGDPFRH